MFTSASMKRKFLDFSLIFLFIALISFAFFYFINHSKNTQAVALSEHIKVTETSDDFINTVKKTQSSNKGNYELIYPETTSSKINDTINRSIKTIKKEFFKSGTANSTLYIDYKVYKYDKFYSFVLTKKIKKDEQYIEKSISTFVFNKLNYKEIAIEDLFATNKNLTHIMNLSQNELVKNKEVKKYNANHKNKLLIDEKTSNFEDFALNNEEIYFYFNTEHFASPFNSSIRIALPLKKLQPYLTDEFKFPVVEDVVSNDKTEKTSLAKSLPASKRNKEKYVSLTFDDGPNSTSTVSILETLKKENIQATFFVLGVQAKAYPDILKRISKEGHEIGNHSYIHRNLAKLSKEEIADDLNKTNKYIKQATGANATVMRPPYGSFDKKLKQSTSMPVVLWTVDTLDWQHHDVNKTIAKVQQQKSKQMTILMHDIHEVSAKALPKIIKDLKDEGYTFVTASEMLAIQENK